LLELEPTGQCDHMQGGCMFWQDAYRFAQRYHIAIIIIVTFCHENSIKTQKECAALEL